MAYHSHDMPWTRLKPGIVGAPCWDVGSFRIAVWQSLSCRHSLHQRSPRGVFRAAIAKIFKATCRGLSEALYRKYITDFWHLIQPREFCDVDLGESRDFLQLFEIKNSPLISFIAMQSIVNRHFGHKKGILNNLIIKELKILRHKFAFWLTKLLSVKLCQGFIQSHIFISIVCTHLARKSS